MRHLSIRVPRSFQQYQRNINVSNVQAKQIPGTDTNEWFTGHPTDKPDETRGDFFIPLLHFLVYGDANTVTCTVNDSYQATGSGFRYWLLFGRE